LGELAKISEGSGEGGLLRIVFKIECKIWDRKPLFCIVGTEKLHTVILGSGDPGRDRFGDGGEDITRDEDMDSLSDVSEDELSLGPSFGIQQ
jgi:hypothetical protein